MMFDNVKWFVYDEDYGSVYWLSDGWPFFEGLGFIPNKCTSILASVEHEMNEYMEHIKRVALVEKLE